MKQGNTSCWEHTHTHTHTQRSHFCMHKNKSIVKRFFPNRLRQEFHCSNTATEHTPFTFFCLHNNTVKKPLIQGQKTPVFKVHLFDDVGL